MFKCKVRKKRYKVWLKKYKKKININIVHNIYSLNITQTTMGHPYNSTNVCIVNDINDKITWDKLLGNPLEIHDN